MSHTDKPCIVCEPVKSVWTHLYLFFGLATED